jgi:hypothetical protein
VRGQQSHDRDQLFTRAGQDDEIGNAPVRRKTVHRVRHELGASRADVLCANDRVKVTGKA